MNGLLINCIHVKWQIRNFNTADQRIVFQEAESLWTEEPFLNASNYHSKANTIEPRHNTNEYIYVYEKKHNCSFYIYDTVMISL